MLQFLSYSFFDNTILNYILFCLSLVISVFTVKGIELILVKRLGALSEKTKKPIDEFLFNIIKRNILPAMYFMAFYFSTKILSLNVTLIKWINIVVLAFTIIICARLISSIIIFYSGKHIKKFTNNPNNILLSKWINGIIKTLVWSIALILFLDNIGIKITSLITGLGIGGIAIAFAAQAILVDFFCYFTIFFDKPFEIGDFIITGEQMGTVEYIGIKTTRLRSLSGEQIILSNSDLTNSRINNYKTMEERRVLFRIGVTYDTVYEKLKEIPELIKNIIDHVEDVRFGRTHFCSYGAYSLDFEIVYYVVSNDYDKYMDINQIINYRIKEEFEKQEIKFAFPTQTLHIKDLTKT